MFLTLQKNNKKITLVVKCRARTRTRARKKYSTVYKKKGRNKGRNVMKHSEAKQSRETWNIAKPSTTEQRKIEQSIIEQNRAEQNSVYFLLTFSLHFSLFTCVFKYWSNTQKTKWFLLEFFFPRRKKQKIWCPNSWLCATFFIRRHNYDRRSKSSSNLYEIETFTRFCRFSFELSSNTSRWWNAEVWTNRIVATLSKMFWKMRWKTDGLTLHDWQKTVKLLAVE